MQTETTLEPFLVDEPTVHYPTLLKRYQSLFIDLLFSILFTFGVAAVLDKVGEVPDWVRIAAFVFIWAVYEPLCQTFGCTVGNYLIGLRVRKATDESKRINILQAYVRYMLKMLLGWISFLTIHSNPQRRALHDLAANSVVIEVK